MTLRMRLSMGFALLLTVIASVVALPTGQASAQVQPVADIAFGAGASNYRNDGDVRIRAGITNNGPDAARVMLTVTIPAGLDVWPDTVRSVADEAKDCNDPGNGEDLVCEFVAAIPAEGFLSTHWGMDPTPAEGPQATFPITGVSITVTPLDGVVDPDLCNNTWDAAGWLQPGDLTAWTQDCDGDGSVSFLNSMDDRIRQEQIDAIVTTNGFDPVETNPCIPTPYATQADFEAAVAANPLVSVTDCEGSPAESNLGVSVVGPGELTEGSNVVTLTVTNNGPDESGSYTATFTVPSGGTINPATLPTGCTADNQVVSCSTAVPIPSGSQASFPIEVIVEPGNHGTVLGPFEGTVEGTSTTHVDLDPSDNETSESFPVEPGGADLVTTVSGGPLIPGQTNNLVITVTNQGPDTSGNYTTTYTIPTGGTVDPTALPAECTIDDQEITCSGGPLGNGGSNTFTIPVFIPNSFGGGTFGPNTVTTTINTGGPTIDPTPTNNTHSTTIAVDDGDGIPASVENSLRDGDGNQDGRPDSQQSNVATFSSPISGDAVTFTTSGANCSAIARSGCPRKACRTLTRSMTIRSACSTSESSVKRSAPRRRSRSSSMTNTTQLYGHGASSMLPMAHTKTSPHSPPTAPPSLMATPSQPSASRCEMVARMTKTASPTPSLSIRPALGFGHSIPYLQRWHSPELSRRSCFTAAHWRSSRESPCGSVDAGWDNETDAEMKRCENGEHPGEGTMSSMTRADERGTSRVNRA